MKLTNPLFTLFTTIKICNEDIDVIKWWIHVQLPHDLLILRMTYIYIAYLFHLFFLYDYSWTHSRITCNKRKLEHCKSRPFFQIYALIVLRILNCASYETSIFYWERRVPFHLNIYRLLNLDCSVSHFVKMGRSIDSGEDVESIKSLNGHTTGRQRRVIKNAFIYFPSGWDDTLNINVPFKKREKSG